MSTYRIISLSLFLLIFSTCTKDAISVNEELTETQQSLIASPNAIASSNPYLNRELPGVHSDLILPQYQEFLAAFVNHLYNLKGNESWGIPLKEGIVVEYCEGETVALIPFVDPTLLDEVSHIMLYFEAEDGDYDFYVVPKNAYTSLHYSGAGHLQNVLNSPEDVITDEDIAYMFGKFDEVLFGKPGVGNGPERRGIGGWGIWPWNWGNGGVNCPSASGGRKKPHFRPNRPGHRGSPSEPADFDGFGNYIFIGGRGYWYNGGSIPTSGGGSGNGGSTLPPYMEEIVKLQFCEGYLEVFDIGENNGTTVYEDFDFCSRWVPYREQCQDSFESYSQMVENFANLLYYNPQVFEYIIDHDGECNGGILLNLIFLKDVPGGYNFEVEHLHPLLRFPERITALINFLSPYIPSSNVSTLKEEIMFQLLALEQHHITPEFIDLVGWFFETYNTYWDNHTSNLLKIEDVPTITEIINYCKDVPDDGPALVEDISEYFEVHEGEVHNQEMFTEWVYYSLAKRFFPELENIDFYEQYNNHESEVGGIPLTTGEIWSRATPIKNDLTTRYPGQAGKISSFFACRILGPAFEKAVLQSLGYENFHSNDAVLPTISGHSFTVRPDGYHAYNARWDPPFGEVVPNSIHCITEVKTKFTSPPVFDWTSNPSQFSQYLDFLYVHQYQGAAPNMLYLILPANVDVAPSIIEACIDKNVLLLTSTVNISFFNSDNVYVTSPICRNAHQITYHENQFRRIIKKGYENMLEGLFGTFDFDSVNFQEILEEKAAAFEASYLIPNLPVGTCPDE